MNILRLNVQFKCQIMEYSPKFGFYRILEKRRKKNQEKTENLDKQESPIVVTKRKIVATKK